METHQQAHISHRQQLPQSGNFWQLANSKFGGSGGETNTKTQMPHKNTDAKCEGSDGENCHNSQALAADINMQGCVHCQQ
jgi:hypothetical protein